MNTTVATAPLELSRRFDASVADLWRAWTEPDWLARWFAPGTMRAEVLAFDARTNGRYRIRMHDDDGETHTVGGRFQTVEPRQRLVMSWAWEGGDAHESTVTVTFTSVGDQAELRIVHAGLPGDESIREHGEGWQGCLAKLEAALGDTAS